MINKFLIGVFVVILFSCNNGTEDSVLAESKTDLFIDKSIKEGEKEGVSYVVDYNKLISKFCLVNNTDTINCFEINEAYSTPIINKAKDYYTIKLFVKGGIRRQKTYLFNSKFELVYDFINYESNFEDKFIREYDKYLDSNSFEITEDTLFIKGIKRVFLDTNYYTKTFVLKEE